MKSYRLNKLTKQQNAENLLAIIDATKDEDAPHIISAEYEALKFCIQSYKSMKQGKLVLSAKNKNQLNELFDSSLKKVEEYTRNYLQNGNSEQKRIIAFNQELYRLQDEYQEVTNIYYNMQKRYHPVTQTIVEFNACTTYFNGLNSVYSKVEDNLNQIEYALEKALFSFDEQLKFLSTNPITNAKFIGNIKGIF